MHLKRATILGFAFFVAIVTSYAQNSYLREITNDNPATLLTNLRIQHSSNGHLFVNIRSSTGCAFDLVEFNDEGVALNSYCHAPDTTSGNWQPLSYSLKGNDHLIVCRKFPPQPTNGAALFYLNPEENIFWARIISHISFRPGRAFRAPNGKFIVNHDMIPGPLTGTNKLGFTQIEPILNQSEWNYHYEIIGMADQLTYGATNIQSTNAGDYSAIVEFQHENLAIERGSNFVKLDSLGNILQSIGMITDSIRLLRHLFDEIGNLYVAGFIETNTTWSSERQRQGFIAKMTDNYEVIWSKILEADNFRFSSLEIIISADNQVLFTYTAPGEFPIIYGVMGSDGNIVSTQGLSFFNPLMSIAPSGEVYFSSTKKYLPDGTSQPATLIIKTDNEGALDSCPQFTSCLSLRDFELNFSPIQWIRSPAPPTEHLAVDYTSGSYTSTPYCGTPTPPSSDFFLPDTICQNICLQPEQLQNRLAHHVEWWISGASVDTVITDTTFLWCFIESGTYFIEQRLWLLGCASSFSHTLTVLPDNLTLPLGEDRLLCQDIPFILEPQSSRPLVSFLWQNGSGESFFPVTTTGQYHLQASDGFCVVNDTVQLTIIEDWLTSPAIILPSDTSLCRDFLPFKFQPFSEYTDEFYGSDLTRPDSVFYLNTSGQHTISALIENCWFTETFHLEIPDCAAPIYLPNIFSPNNDGINDLLIPQGEEFTPIQLGVFDRWGNLVYQATEAPFAWDGTFKSNILSQGVYLVVFTFYNQRNFQEETIAKDVVLVH